MRARIVARIFYIVYRTQRYHCKVCCPIKITAFVYVLFTLARKHIHNTYTDVYRSSMMLIIIAYDNFETKGSSSALLLLCLLRTLKLLCQ